MPCLAYTYLVLAALSTLVSSGPTPSPTTTTTTPAVYNNCSEDYPLPLPSGAAFTPYLKPHISTDTNETSVGWEEWLVFAHGYSTDGLDITYGYRWSMGDPGSADLSNSTFSVWLQFGNGTVYHQLVHDVFEYEENAGGGFTYSIANNHLTWDPVQDSWQVSVNAGGLITETHVEVVEPGLPFVPNYNSTPGQLCDGFFTQIEVPRGHMIGYLTLPSGLNITTEQGIGSLKHTWSHRPIADTLIAYVRGTAFFREVTTTVSWYQAWDPSGKEIDSMQLLQPGDSPESQVFRIQITDSPEVLSIVTTPAPTSLPLSYNSTELTLPMCAPGVDFENTDRRMTWRVANVGNLFDFVDSAGGITLYQRVNVTGVVQVNETLRGISSGTALVEVYHRG